MSMTIECRSSRWCAAAAFALFVVFAAPTVAGERFLAITSDNDLYVDGRDRHYTAGNRATWGFAAGKAPGWLTWLGHLTLLDAPVGSAEVDLSIGQSIYTPENIRRVVPDPTDQAYAGWLFGELVTLNRDGTREDEFAISLGVVGPASLAEEAHELLHDLTPSQDPLGWDAQLDDEPAIVVRYRRSWFAKLAQNGETSLDIVPRLYTKLGNVVTEAGIGSDVRIGSNLTARDVGAGIGPGRARGSVRFDSRGRFDWMFRAGVAGRAVAHNVFLDGNTFGDELPSVDRRTLTWDASTGATLIFGQFSVPVALSFNYQWRGREFDGQRGINRIGSVVLSTRF